MTVDHGDDDTNNPILVKSQRVSADNVHALFMAQPQVDRDERLLASKQHMQDATSILKMGIE